ncbi:hypothetical protein VN97_g2986 [Penicillium thymicola]|uniref:Uncharacterized protein n=1 Tax=Penicillium thymicola TaxID=293382 RepID=A0AAI9XAT9_PENTH|nr:hypothetical protein VN97_g2986 [Penicillium thymicola]
MKPLSVQIVTATNIVSKALVRATVVEPPPQQEPDKSYEDLYKRLDRTLAGFGKVDPAKITTKEGQSFKAPIGTNVFYFTLEDYSARFLIPNFYFMW